MRSFILLSLLAMFLFSCNSESQEAKDKQQDKSKDRAERV
jgi:PBP1b-binding outer membrane lipoprotein LpoB